MRDVSYTHVLVIYIAAGVASPTSPTSPIRGGFVRYAIDIFGDKVEATPEEKFATCPLCKSWCIPKCGSIVTWHWAHEKRADCDTWSEGETEWHRGWKRMVSPQFQEVCKGPHRADIVGNKGVVIELQHSPISPETIEAREIFYGKMIWLFDASDFHDNIQFRKNDDTNYRSFRWKHARKTQLTADRPVFWDIPEYKTRARTNYLRYADGTSREERIPSKTIPRFIFEVKKFHENGNGWGYKWTVEKFIETFLSSVLHDRLKFTEDQS